MGFFNEPSFPRGGLAFFMAQPSKNMSLNRLLPKSIELLCSVNFVPMLAR